MSYQRERDEFIARMSREGLDVQTTRQLLRYATTLHRLAELACSSEAADRDRVPCPAVQPDRRVAGVRAANPCLCDFDHEHHRHTDIPRITLQDYHVEQRAKAVVPTGWAINTQGDPRGYVLRVIPPSYAERNTGRDVHNLDAIGVPAADSRLRF